MYSQNELDEAVAAGAISADAAASLRNHIHSQRALPAVDEEQFRLITGFNDIFVAIAAIILLVAIGWIGQAIGEATGTAISRDGPSFIAPAAVAATSWALALFFTARRRMALPSILLLLAFIGSVFTASCLLLVLGIGGAQLENNAPLGGAVAAAAGAITAGAAWLHWRRFRVPITVAAGAAAVVAIAIGLLVAALGQDFEFTTQVVTAFVLLLGVGVFLVAMRWDSSDPARVTRRSDVAFWLHLLAAPMMVHPIFTLLGLNDGQVTVGEGLVVVLLYVLIGVTALAIDRRALLVSALAYVLFALNALFKQFGAIELNVALTALVIGSSLLLLSAFWHQARQAVVRPLPDSLKSKLPLLDRQPAVSAQAA
ncbi:hypothetical protein H8M03_01030 [Sphingomonas sabuli]|uniref:DUF2157 domain-containing protein n=1 Tax=Sphingomonas sabuli TaxID=2764186 RepID=A0A7G9L2Y0_9SPHN|nr:hypothetical protein [Sphingomonas sabuli]QNM82979.1 hypothetical protein H8M03_01030 [Sphingomonas sabuli]